MEQVDQAHDGRLPELIRLLAEPLARLLGHGQRVRHRADVLDEEQVPEVLEQIRDEPTQILALLRELLDETKRAGAVAVDHEVADAEEGLLLDRAQELQDGLDGDLALRRSRELVERRDGVAERAARAARDERQRGVGRVDLLAVGNRAEQADELGESRPLEDERLTARPDRREHLREVRRAEDEDEVRRRLLDELQQGVERGVGELVRLVEDVHLVPPSAGCSTTRSRISRMSSIPRCDAASISITSREVPLAIVTQGLQTLHGVGVGPCTQLRPLARMRAIEVFPVPRGPAKR